jgi:hypothetical protein
MKKIILLVCALIIVAACAAPPTNNESTVTNRSSETTAAAPLTEADAIAKEKSIWETLKRRDYDAFGNMLATDYLEVLADGVRDKTATINGVKDLEITDVTFADWRLVPIDKDAALLLYNATMKGKFKGEAFPEGPYRVSSAFVNRDGKWQAIYYQETMVEPAPAAPAATPSPATTSASPRATATSTTLPADAVERERIVWDALKRRDYDAFASHLDDASVEVESTGVYDKAGTVNAVRTADLSKVELSDFKTVKMNANAELVNYLVTVPGPKPEKHWATTLWVNRGGKWLALFHQGTTVMPPGPSMASSPSASPSPSPSVSPRY